MTSAALMERHGAAGTHPGGEKPTLDDLFVELWTEIGAQRTPECLLCGESMVPVFGAHARPVAGRCTGCGSELR